MGDRVPKRFTRFRQADIKRAAKGLSDAGVRDFRIEVDPNGKIIIQAGSAATRARGSSWDDI